MLLNPLPLHDALHMIYTDHHLVMWLHCCCWYTSLTQQTEIKLLSSEKVFHITPISVKEIFIPETDKENHEKKKFFMFFNKWLMTLSQNPRNHVSAEHLQGTSAWLLFRKQVQLVWQSACLLKAKWLAITKWSKAEYFIYHLKGILISWNYVNMLTSE